MKKVFLSLAFAMVCVAPAFAAMTQPTTAKPTEPKKEAATEEKSGAAKPSLVLVANACCDQTGKEATASDKNAPEKAPAKTSAPKLAFA